MSNHRQQLDKLRAMKRELSINHTQLTPYERQRMETAIEAQANMTRGLIEAGVRQEWAAALENHRGAQAALNAARKREAARWQPDRLAMEFQLANAAFARAWSVADAQREYNQALASGDAAKIRAYSEVFSAALTKFHDDRLNAHRLASEAAHKVQELQTTDEIINATARLSKAVDQVVSTRNDVLQISQEVGLFELSRAVEKVTIKTDHDPDKGTWAYSIVEPAEVA